MNFLGLLFLVVCIALVLMLPRRWAPLPLLIGTCYMTLGQQVAIGPFNFSVIRILLGFGMLRVMARREGLSGGVNGLDWGMVAWAAWAVLASVFYEDFSAALTFRLGLVYNVCGAYFLFRIFCQSFSDAVLICRMLALLLLPLAAEMLFEKVAGHNLFSVLGRVSELSMSRLGRIRAQGPFAHPILAGTAGAVCLPLIVTLWKGYRREAVIGIGACLAIVFASGSSGPIMSLMAGAGALLMWIYRERVKTAKWFLVAGYVGLDLIMNDPAYYIMARIDISGGSTGWHRARLIQSAIEHFNEWWVAGTDYTRHWMASGVDWSPDHTDITNYYLKMGVWGGMPLVLLYCVVLVIGFKYIGLAVRDPDRRDAENQFMLWGFGSSLFAHAVTGLGVSYYDQSFVFIYLVLAVISSVHQSALAASPVEPSPGAEAEPVHEGS